MEWLQLNSDDNQTEFLPTLTKSELKSLLKPLRYWKLYSIT